MYLDMTSNGNICPIDAADPNSVYAPELQASMLTIAGVTSSTPTSVGCIMLAPDGEFLRWTFNVVANYNPNVIDLPTAMTNFDDANPPALCGPTLLSDFCTWFDDNLATPVARSSGSPNSIQSCDPSFSIVALVDLTAPDPAAPDPAPYLAGQYSGVFFTTGRSPAAIVRIDECIPYDPTGDNVALKFIVDSGDFGTVTGRMFFGPDCPVLYDSGADAISAWPPGPNMAIGSMNQITDIGFRAYSETNALLGLTVTFSVTQSPPGEVITANDVIDLNWQCSYQSPSVGCSAAINNWVDFNYDPTSIRLWMRTRGQACSGGATVDYNTAAKALTWDDWSSGSTVTTTVGSTICTSPVLDGDSRVLSVSITATGTGGAISTYYLDGLYIWGNFEVLPAFRFNAYYGDFTFP